MSKCCCGCSDNAYNEINGYIYIQVVLHYKEAVEHLKILLKSSKLQSGGVSSQKKTSF